MGEKEILDNPVLNKNSENTASIANADVNSNLEIIGTARLRKVTSQNTTMEMLKLASELAKGGYDKKLWSLLSRVYQDKKAFTDTEDVNESTYCDTEKISEYIDVVMKSNMPSEYKMQMFTSFNIPKDFKPTDTEVESLVENCSKKRLNIAGYFIIAYGYEKLCYKQILANKDIFKVIAKSLDSNRLVCLYEYIIENENKEIITGAIRTLSECKPRLRYKDDTDVVRVTKLVFDSKEVFFTTKLMYCLTFDAPKKALPENRELYKILKISVNYEERISREFVKKYNLDFDCGDEAMCKYYIGNKKATNQKLLVSKFANHIVRIEDNELKSKLLRSAFKRGGYFRMYAGCMQDGKIIEEKLHRFHYSDEDIEWCRTLSGLREDK